jgi:hypothetical protein
MKQGEGRREKGEERRERRKGNRKGEKEKEEKQKKKRSSGLSYSLCNFLSVWLRENKNKGRRRTENERKEENGSAQRTKVRLRFIEFRKSIPTRFSTIFPISKE